MRPAIALALLQVVALLGGMASGSGTALEGPRLTVGDSWTYQTNTSIGSAFFFDGQATLRFVHEEPEIIEGITYDAVRMSVSGSGTAGGSVSTRFGSTPATGSWTLNGEETLESAGLKVVSSVIDLRANGTLHTEPVAVLFELRVQNTTTLRLFDDHWKFPIGIGSSTVVVGQMNFSEDSRLSYGIWTTVIHTSGQVWRNLTYGLETQIAVDTPAGPFDAYRIREVDAGGNYTLLFYAPAAGNFVRTEGYNGSSRIARSELVSYRYQALEPARFLGLTGEQWTIASGVIAATASVALVWWLRKKRRRPSSTEIGPIPPPT